MAATTSSNCESSTKLYFCDHCEKLLSKTLYYKHKKFYYDRNSEKWRKEMVHYVEDDFDFSESDPGSGIYEFL